MTFYVDRRPWLAGFGAVFVAAASALAFAQTQSAAAPPAPPAPPVARVAVVTDTYYGETLSDAYRWMENDKDPAWLPFLKGQNDYARAILDALPGRNDLLHRVEQLSGDIVATAHLQREGGRVFFQQRPLGADNFKLFAREGGNDRILVDPTQMSGTNAGHFSLDWWQASPDGTSVVYGVSKDGSEDSIAHILRVADGQALPWLHGRYPLHSYYEGSDPDRPFGHRPWFPDSRHSNF